MHEANALTIRICKYVAAVIALSSIFTLTKFLEGKIEWTPKKDTITNATVLVPEIVATELRTTPWYTMYYNWSRLLVLGVIPFVMLVYLNAQIFKDIKARSKRRFNTKAAVNQNNTTGENEKVSMARNIKNKILFRKKPPSSKKLTTLQVTGDKVTYIDGSIAATTTAEMTEITHLHTNNPENMNGDNDIQTVLLSTKETSQKYDEGLTQDKGTNNEDIQTMSEICTIKDNETVLKDEENQKTEMSAETLNSHNTISGKH